MTTPNPTNSGEMQPPNSPDMTVLYTAAKQVIEAMKAGENEQGYEVCRGMIDNPTVPIHFQAWFHLILSSNLWSGSASHHAEESVTLFGTIKEMMGEEAFSRTRVSNVARIAEASLVKSKAFEKEHKISFTLHTNSEGGLSHTEDPDIDHTPATTTHDDEEDISQMLFEFEL
jgi:hypothetical protein